MPRERDVLHVRNLCSAMLGLLVNETNEGMSNKGTALVCESLGEAKALKAIDRNRPVEGLCTTLLGDGIDGLGERMEKHSCMRLCMVRKGI
jgi:hypothetical protein